MILLWKPSFVPEVEFDRYVHCWFLQAARAGEPVIVQELSAHNLDVNWDRVMDTPGRMVVWALPHFIPSPAFFDELDLYLDEKFRLILLRRYDAVFQPGAVKPCEWKEDGGVSSGLVIFQLNGQDRLKLPSSRRVQDYWQWLAKKRSSSILRLPQRYAGLDGVGPMARSNLGILMPDVWQGQLGVFGRIITGDSNWYDKQKLHRHYLDRLEGWELWLQKQKQ